MLGATVALGALAGCGGGGSGNGVASLGGGKEAQQASDDGSGHLSQREREAAFRKFTQCMRDHGVEMQDPEIGDDGSFTITAQADAQAGTGPADPGFADANEACQKYLDGVINGGDRQAPSAEEIAKIQRQALKFARCMAKVTGRPVSSDRRMIQSISRSGAERSSPITPAGASSNTPVPAALSARPIANSSSSAANVPGTGSPSIARCAIVRDVDTPSAPASMPSCTMRAIASMSSGVAGSLRAPRSPIT